MRRSIGRTVLQRGMATMVVLASLTAGACGSSSNPTPPTTPTLPTAPTVTETFSSDLKVNGASTFVFLATVAGRCRPVDDDRSGRIAGNRIESRHVERIVVPGGHRQRRRRAELDRDRSGDRRNELVRKGLRRRTPDRSPELHHHRRPSVVAGATRTTAWAGSFQTPPPYSSTTSSRRRSGDAGRRRGSRCG